jgi:hypothetical protein
MTNPIPEPIANRQQTTAPATATPTETQLTQQFADTAWRRNRVPILEAALPDRAANPPSEQARIEFDIVDATAPSPLSTCTPSGSPASSERPPGTRPEARRCPSRTP